MNKLIIILSLIFSTGIVYGQNEFSSEKLQSDARLLWKVLNELHPGLYRHADTLTLENAYQKLLKDFSEDRNAEAVLLSLSKFTSKIKCGHTYVNPFNQRNEIINSVLNHRVLLPFTFVIIDKKIIIDVALTEGLNKHNVISHINGIEVASIIDSLAGYIKADGNRNRKRIKDLEVHLTSKYEYFDYFFGLIYGFTDTVELTISNEGAKIIPLQSKPERDKAYSQLFPNANSSNYDELWEMNFYESHAYLKLGTFVTWRLSFDWEEYLDNFFEEVNSRGISNLIIDVRGNEGGTSEVSEYLVTKLAKREGETVYRKPHLAYKKVSDDIKPHLSTWSKWFYNTSIWTKKLDANYRTIKFSANKPQKIAKNKNAFIGQTYLLIDESNSSATFILAEVCKKNHYATLIGTETGGTKKGITAGQIFFLTLPNTNIEVDIPLIGRYPMGNLADEGVQPDIWVEKSLQGYLNNRDEQREKAIELMQEIKTD